MLSPVHGNIFVFSIDKIYIVDFYLEWSKFDFKLSFHFSFGVELEMLKPYGSYQHYEINKMEEEILSFSLFVS